MGLKFENILKKNIGKKVRITFETHNADSFAIGGDLIDVTDDYIKIRGLTNIYVNRRATVITYIEIFDEGEET